MTACGTTHTTEEATVYVYDLDMFVNPKKWETSDTQAGVVLKWSET